MPTATRPPAFRPALWVVKLGGSLWDSAALRPWLSRLAAERRTRLVIVPGGGPFADAVRRAQPLLGTSDKAAHRMAILAMEQYAHALLDLEPGLAPAASRSALLNAGAPVVWLPAAMAMQADLPDSWDVTSDSIAAWLAEEIGADRLVLVKSAALPAGEASVQALARDGIVDPVLPRRMAGLSGEVLCVARDGLAGFAAALDDCAWDHPGSHLEGSAAFGTRLFLESGEHAHA